jgi:hypothetical protein
MVAPARAQHHQAAGFEGGERSRRVSHHSRPPTPPRTTIRSNQVQVESSLVVDAAAAAPVGPIAPVASVGPVTRAVAPVGPTVGSAEGDSFGGFSLGGSVVSGTSVGEVSVPL